MGVEKIVEAIFKGTKLASIPVSHTQTQTTPTPPPPEVRERKTYTFQSPPTQYPLRRSRHIPPIPLQIPHDAPSRSLRKHLLDHLDVCLPGAHVAPAAVVRGRGGCGGREEEVADCEAAEEDDEEELRDVDCLFGGRHGFSLYGRCKI